MVAALAFGCLVLVGVAVIGPRLLCAYRFGSGGVAPDEPDCPAPSPSRATDIAARGRLVAAFGDAIRQGGIEPFFQPFVELGTGRVIGFEVLARWRDETGHVRLPGDFLPLAEERGLVDAMYRSLLAAAATEARKWPEEWSFAFNLSYRQLFDENLVEETLRIILGAGIPPHRLEIEIAETVLDRDPDRALDVVEAFRRRGVRAVLDNFGTGRLHLRELARFPFDRIKVDHVAICRDGAEPNVALGLIAAAGRHLGVPILVQGIETHACAEAAQVNGCAIGQGFLFGRPGRRTECFRLDGALAPRDRQVRHRVA